MSDNNLLAVLAATVGQFAVGAVWYMPLFGKLWGKMHDFDKISKAKQDEMRAKMGPYYGVQFLATVLTAYVLSKMMEMLPNYSGYSLAVVLWLGFVVPTQVAGVIFGGTDEKWMVKKILVQAFGSLACLLVAVAILNMF